MPLTSAEYSKRWRSKHPEKDREVHLKYYHNHKQQSYARVVRFRQYKSECKRLMSILLE